MARVDVRRLAWAVNRWFLLRGRGAWLIAAGLLALLWVLVLLAASLRQHMETKARWEDRVLAAVGEGAAEAPEPLAFPRFAQRFETTAEMLDALGIDQSLAGKASIAWDRSDESGLATQTLTLDMQAPWERIGETLDRAQSAVPTAYIARLDLSRDSALDDRVSAGLRITLVYRDPPQDAGR